MKKQKDNSKQTALWQDNAPPKSEKKKAIRQRAKSVAKKVIETGKTIVGNIARGTYSSTVLRYFSEYCPKALDFYRKGTPESTDHFQVGIAAHAVLQVIGEKKAANQKAMERIADAVVKELITTGRKYYDEPRPPMKPEYAIAGRDLALQYLSQNKLPAGAKYEIVLAMDKSGKKCNLENARYRAIVDCVYETIEGDEDFAMDVIAVRDYKSAWPTDEAELETLQRKGQAVLASIHWPDKKGVRMEVVNLRTGKVYSKTIYLDEVGKEYLARWRQDILMECDAADKTNEARPGVGCVKCPFNSICPDALKLEQTPKNATALAVLEARREDLREKLKIQLDDADGIRVNGGFVGYNNQPCNSLTNDAIYQILAMWYSKQPEEIQYSLPREVGLLRALSIGAAQVKAVASHLFREDGKAAREDFVNLCLKKEPQIKFGIWKASDEELAGMNLLPPNGKLPRAKRAAKSKSKKAA